MSEPTVKRLDSGYWHVRWCANLWLQWPIGREAVLSDGFGWVDEQHVRAANRLTEEPPDER